MGASNSVFSEEELEEYQELTYFTKKEIVHVYKKFAEVASQGMSDTRFDIQTKVPMKTVLSMEELKVIALYCLND